MSRKRAKAEGVRCEGEMGMDDAGSPRLDPLLAKPMLSYASMLRNSSERSMEEVEVDFSDADCCFVQGESGLAVNFSEKVHSVLENSWRFAVVVNLMGKPNSVNSFDFILRGLRRKWRSSGGWKLIDLPNDYFVVKFELEDDMNEALCGGPWILSGQTLVVRRWSADFNPLTDRIGSMAVWARIVGLPIMYFTEYTMSKVGKLLGEVIKVDQVTLNQERGRFGRVCVEIDLSRPFKSVVEVDGVKYKVQYEGLSLLCFGCGVYGHSKDKCPNNCANDVNMGEVSGDAPVSEQVKSCENVHSEDKGLSEVRNGGRISEDSDGLGPWMLINYRSKKKLVKNGGSEGGKGSRFSALQDLVVEDVAAVNIHPAIHPGNGSNAASMKATKVPAQNFNSKKAGAVKSGFGEPVGEVSQMWSCLQSKLKERVVLGEPWVIGEGNGALVQVGSKEAGDVSYAKVTDGVRVPFVDMSNAGAGENKVSSKGLKKSAGAGKFGLAGKSRMPFPKNSALSNSNFSGFFGRCPPEEVINKEIISSLATSKEADRGSVVEVSSAAMDDGPDGYDASPEDIPSAI